jgi:hypothetical protein
MVAIPGNPLRYRLFIRRSGCRGNRRRNHFRHSRNGAAKLSAARRGSLCLSPMTLMTIDSRLQMKNFEIVLIIYPEALLGKFCLQIFFIRYLL